MDIGKLNTGGAITFGNNTGGCGDSYGDGPNKTSGSACNSQNNK